MTSLNEERTNILKGCGKEFDIVSYGYVICGEFYYNVNGGDMTVLCPSCQAKLSQHDKTMKLVMEEIDKLINNFLNGLDADFCKDEKDIIQKNYGIEVLEELKKSLDSQSPQCETNSNEDVLLGSGDNLNPKWLKKQEKYLKDRIEGRTNIKKSLGGQK